MVAAVSRLVDASEQQVHMQLRRALGDQNDLTAYVLLPHVHKPFPFCDTCSLAENSLEHKQYCIFYAIQYFLRGTRLEIM